MSCKTKSQESRAGVCGMIGTTAVAQSMKQQVQHAKPWSLLHQCSLDQWKSGHAGATGFTETVMTCNGRAMEECNSTFCMSRQSIVNVNKSGRLFSFRRKSRLTKMTEHFEYNLIPAQLSCIQNFHVGSVLCYHDNILVLHLVRNLMSQFGVINLNINKFTGIFGKKGKEFRDQAMQGKISPDCNFCLIKIPSMTCDYRFDLQLYSLQSRELLAEIVVPYCNTLFSFDPRFCGSRMAVTGFVEGEKNSLSLVRLPVWEVLATNSSVDYRHPGMHTHKELQYSRDGQMIFIVKVRSGCHCIDERRAQRHYITDITICIMSSHTLQKLHCIQHYRYACHFHTCPTVYVPVLSACGSRMAFVHNIHDSNTDHVQVYKLPVLGDLQSRCRVCILQTFAPEFIPRLPLPTRLINYLKFKPGAL